MTIEVPGPLNDLSSSVLKLQTKETLGHRDTAAQECTVNQAPPCGNMRVSTCSSHRTYPSWSASAPARSPRSAQEPSARRRSVMPIFHLPACAHATPPRNSPYPILIIPIRRIQDLPTSNTLC